MIQRICPICDQVMKHAHYCSACRSWVKDPVSMNVTYYLNERHPKNEAHCSYHTEETGHADATFASQNAMPWELGNTRKNSKKKTVPNQPRRNTVVRSQTAENRSQSVQTAWQTGEGKAEHAKPTVKKVNLIKIVVLIYMAIVVLSWIMSVAGGLVTAFFGIY